MLCVYMGGSHVVVLVPPRAVVAEEDIVFAARIAATHSKAKRDTYVDVRSSSHMDLYVCV